MRNDGEAWQSNGEMPACAGAKQPLRGRKAIVDMLHANDREWAMVNLPVSVYSVYSVVGHSLAVPERK